jgi:DNA-directed RNA polymerase specialized sigma24 family protein
MTAPSLESLLIRDRAKLLEFISRRAGAPLLRFESAEDLVQGVHHEVLRSPQRFEWQGEEQFSGWLRLVAKRYLAGRRDHWFALKRNGGALLRLSWGATDGHGRTAGAGGAADTRTGPVTFALRREQVILATRAAAMLMPRDRNIVNWCAEGVAIDVQAARLGVSRKAAEHARNAALERLRKVFRLVSQSPRLSSERE